jgi:hypothetical protein
MKARMKDNPELVFTTGKFNTHAVGEVIGYSDSFGADLFFIKNLDVQLSSGEWKDMGQAFKDHDIICDNYNTCFFEPENEEDRKRGFTLH